MILHYMNKMYMHAGMYTVQHMYTYENHINIHFDIQLLIKDHYVKNYY